MGDQAAVKKALASHDPDWVKRVGNEQYKKGCFSEALALYDRAIALDPNQAAFHGNRAAVLTSLNRIAEAVKECELAIQLDPNFARAHQRLGGLLTRFGKLDEAMWHLHKSEELGAERSDTGKVGTLQEHISKAGTATANQDWDEALRQAEMAIQAGADLTMDVWKIRVKALLQLRRLAEAEKVLQEAQQAESAALWPGAASSDSELLCLRAEIDIALGSFESAAVASEQAARLDRENKEIARTMKKAKKLANVRNHGNELFRAGKYAAAIAAYNQGLELSEKNAVLLSNCAACLMKQGEWEEALQDCDEAVASNPKFSKARLRRAQCYMQLDRWEEAINDCEILKKEMPGDEEVSKCLFNAQLAMKKHRGEDTSGIHYEGDGIVTIRSSEKYKEMMRSSGLTVAWFTATWCGPCRQITPVVTKLNNDYPLVKFLKIDVDENQDLALSEGIQSVPTFRFIKAGRQVSEIKGANALSLEATVKMWA